MQSFATIDDSIFVNSSFDVNKQTAFSSSDAHEGTSFAKVLITPVFVNLTFPVKKMHSPEVFTAIKRYQP